MKKFILPLLGIFSLLLFSCQSSSSDSKNETKKSHPSEIITSSFSIKKVDSKIEKDTVNMIQSYTYDKSGKELANIFYNLDGTVSWKDVYDYDEKGNKIGSKFYDKGTQLTSYYKYELDSKGNVIHYKSFDINTDTILYEVAFRYENEGKLKKNGWINNKGEFQWNYEYLYDENGKELGYNYIDNKGKIYPEIYNYTKSNTSGEWIEREILIGDEVQRIEVREFKM